MIRRILLAAIAVATIGTSVAADARPDDRRDRREVRHDRREVRHDVRHDRRDGHRQRYFHRGRYYNFFHGGRYYNYRDNRNGVWVYR